MSIFNNVLFATIWLFQSKQAPLVSFELIDVVNEPIVYVFLAFCLFWEFLHFNCGQLCRCCWVGQSWTKQHPDFASLDALLIQACEWVSHQLVC